MQGWVQRPSLDMHQICSRLWHLLMIRMSTERRRWSWLTRRTRSWRTQTLQPPGQYIKGDASNKQDRPSGCGGQGADDRDRKPGCQPYSSLIQLQDPGTGCGWQGADDRDRQGGPEGESLLATTCLLATTSLLVTTASSWHQMLTERRRWSWSTRRTRSFLPSRSWLEAVRAIEKFDMIICYTIDIHPCLLKLN